MAQATAVVRGTLSATLNGTTDFTSSGFGTPSAAIVIFCIAGATANPQNNAEIGFGFWDGTNQSTAEAIDVDNSATMTTFRGSNDSYGVINGTTESDYTITSITDGIRLTLTVDGTGLQRFATVILISGVSAKVVTMTANATQNATATSASLGFAPKMVFCGGISGATADVGIATTTAMLSLGVAEIGGVHRSTTWNSTNGVADEASAILHSETRSYARVIANALVWGIEVTNFGADDFTVTTRDGAAPTGPIFFALALGGADLSYDLGTLTTPTVTGDQVNATTVSTTALFLAATNASSTTIETTGPGANSFMYGMASSSNQYSHTIVVEDGAATSNSASAATTTEILDLNNSAAGVSSAFIDGAVTLNASDFTINYTLVDTTARKGWWVAFGPAGSPPAPTSNNSTLQFLQLMGLGT